MRVIEQDIAGALCIENFDNLIEIVDSHDDSIFVDKQGAKQLIDVLKEFINDSSVS